MRHNVWRNTGGVGGGRGGGVRGGYVRHRTPFNEYDEAAMTLFVLCFVFPQALRLFKSSGRPPQPSWNEVSRPLNTRHSLVT